MESSTGRSTIGGKEFKPILGGKWELNTDATGVKAVFADPNKLILTYKGGSSR